MHRCFRFPPDTRRSARELRLAEAGDQPEGEVRECREAEARQAAEEAGEEHLTRRSQENNTVPASNVTLKSGFRPLGWVAIPTV